MSSFCSVLPQMQPNQTPLGNVGRKTAPSIGISDQSTPHGLAGHLQPRTRIAAQHQQAMRKKRKAKKKKKVVERGSNLIKLRCSRTLHLVPPKRSCAKYEFWAQSPKEQWPIEPAILSPDTTHETWYPHRNKPPRNAFPPAIPSTCLKTSRRTTRRAPEPSVAWTASREGLHGSGSLAFPRRAVSGFIP